MNRSGLFTLVVAGFLMPTPVMAGEDTRGTMPPKTRGLWARPPRMPQ